MVLLSWVGEQQGRAVRETWKSFEYLESCFSLNTARRERMEDMARTERRIAKKKNRPHTRGTDDKGSQLFHLCRIESNPN